MREIMPLIKAHYNIDYIGNGVRDFAVWFLGNIIYIAIFAGVALGGFGLLRPVIRRVKGKKKLQKTTEYTEEEPQ